ncbi:tryptophan synthase subunit alpha [Fodinicola feengrottensis]|uniref:tryptophan synthase subunit alpha n=1 Tax=Fodinicola feengrottensis TaxID=435914 RepID=UPI0036F41D7F
MSVATAFEKASGRSALVGYLPAGYPSVTGAIDAMKAMVDSGVDIIEVGLPYSDPVMDGPTIQAAPPRRPRWTGGCTPRTSCGPSRRSPPPAYRPSS